MAARVSSLRAHGTVVDEAHARRVKSSGDVVTPSGDTLFCMLMFSIVSENAVSAFGKMAMNFIVIFSVSLPRPVYTCT